jgi:hypothetical protein
MALRLRPCAVRYNNNLIVNRSLSLPPTPTPLSELQSHSRLREQLSAGQTVRTPRSDRWSSGGQGDPGWTPSRIQLGKTCSLISLRRNAVEKIPWHGVLTSVQPRNRLGRSFNQRSHRSGPTRKVLGHRGMRDTKEDWVVEDATPPRRADE